MLRTFQMPLVHTTIAILTAIKQEGQCTEWEYFLWGMPDMPGMPGIILGLKEMLGEDPLLGFIAN